MLLFCKAIVRTAGKRVESADESTTTKGLSEVVTSKPLNPTAVPTPLGPPPPQRLEHIKTQLVKLAKTAMLNWA